MSASPTSLSLSPSGPARASSAPRQVTPSPAFSRPPSVTPASPDWRYPPVRTQPPSTPDRPRQQNPRIPSRESSSDSPSTPSTLSRAVNTALPSSPPTQYHSPHSTPPSSFPARFGNDAELSPITPRRTAESPFDDRHSILLETMTAEVEDEDPFVFQYAGGGARRQKTMPGYKFARLSPPGRDIHGDVMTFGPQLDRISPISQARRSLYPALPPIPVSTLEQHPDITSPQTPARRPRPQRSAIPVKPTFRGVFALSRRRDYLVHLFPAILVSIAGSLVQPYMSIVIGNSFAIFTAYPIDTQSATASDRAVFISGTRKTTIQLAVAGLIAVGLNYLKGVLWTRHGETLVSRLRTAIYEGVQSKGMDWFDTGMGMKVDEEDEKKGEAIGAGGLMAKFLRETDDVRLGTSQALGLVVQYFATFLLCFILALIKSPVLALVTISTIPLVVLTQIVTQVVCAPLYEHERRAFAEASTNIERASSAISTVKAYNGQQSEVTRFTKLISRAGDSLVRQALVWGISIGMTDFLLLGTFVVGFWYGAKVVRDGKSSAGEVMTVFWACLLAATYLQMIVPQLTIMTKGKNSMASLLTVIQDGSGRQSSGNHSSRSTSPQSANFPRHPLSLKGIHPIRCRGEFNLRNISFAYPSRPDQPVLRDVTLFLPPGETTFIVGGSGSGKSTIAQLLLRLYLPDGGEISLDDQSFPYLDEGFTRVQIAAVQQGCILFDLSIHDNVAMGLAGAGLDPKMGLLRRPKDVTREEVVAACKMAMIHDFIESLPEGYETKLGTGGSALSGGQKQRLAIARARVRDPAVLILDEATSALDATSRVLVFEAMKQWRKNRTTIVITHDLSQILADDFVYVMQDGIVAEQGFRSDLMKKTPMYGQGRFGVFARMAAEQAIEPIALKMEEWRNAPDDVEILDGEDTDETAVDGRARALTLSFAGLRPNSMMYLDILDEYIRGGRSSISEDRRDSRRMSRPLSIAQKRLSWASQDLKSRRPSRPLSIAQKRLSWSPQDLDSSRPGNRTGFGDGRRGSQITGPSYDASIHLGSLILDKRLELAPSEKDEVNVLRYSYYQNRTLSEGVDDDLKKADLTVATDRPPVKASATKSRGLFALIIHFYPTLPNKCLLFLGIIGSIGHGVSTPIWASYLAKLMAIVGTGGTDPSLTKYGIIVLGLCAVQALADFTQEYCLYALAARWTTSVRGTAFGSVLSQDKAWFDETKNSPSRLVQCLIKDADDMRALMGSVLGKMCVFIAMVGLGIIWAMVVDWKLTLIGIALAPVFAMIMVVNEAVIGKAEVTNKLKREAVARTFYESIANIRGIRAMALDGAFRENFQQDTIAAKKSGRGSAWIMAIGMGASAGLPLFAQGLLNWAGLQFMLRNYLNYHQMLQVYNLVLFSLTFGTQMLDFIPAITKAKVAATDFDRLFALPVEAKEAEGDLRFPITGTVHFDRVTFAYPTRPDIPVLSDLSFKLVPGEYVAIVGPSGSGKSTIAALLQRLYEPTSGEIRMDRFNLHQADVKWLRNHIAVVSQSANLFDASVAENIAYGSDIPLGEIHRAAKAANIHGFIQNLPQGYDTKVGENASLISGGQAQRLQIARALVRRSNILILDECTSALDVDNQRAVLDTIVKIKDMRTTIFITHSVEAMRRCDRVICLGDGRVAEDGSYDELIARGGVFAHLMRTGEWDSSPLIRQRDLTFRAFHSSSLLLAETVKVPQMAESITEGTLKQWSKAVGDYVKQDEEIATIETDKIDVSVNAPMSGKITEFLVEEDTTVSVGQDLLKIEPGEDGGDEPPPAKPEGGARSEPKDAEEGKKDQAAPAAGKEKGASEDTHRKQDEKAPKMKSSEEEKPAPRTQEKQPAPKKEEKPAPKEKEEEPKQDKVVGSRNETRVKMSRMRQTIAQRLKASQNAAASLTTFNEIDMSSLMEFRTLYKDGVLKNEGVKLGFMSAFARAACLALKELPAANSSIEGDAIVYRDFVDLSVAVATPKGLVTPVVRNAEGMGLVEIEKAIAELGKKARDNKLGIEDMSGGSFTISNGGVFGSLYGTPIINLPQAAVLGMHAIKEKPVVVNGLIVIRPIMIVALTYDHRLLDGREAVTFLVRIKEYIEDPRRMLLPSPV